MRNIFIFAALLLPQSWACQESRKLDATCGAYCFQAVKPILGHTTMLQEQLNQQNVQQQTEVKSELENIKIQLLAIKESIALGEQREGRFNRNLKGRNMIFKRIGSKYYYIENYEQMNWFAAAHRCIELGSHLVSLQNQQEYDNLKSYLSTKRNYWIDINDLSNEGQFLSLTSGREATYLNWASNNPNNFLYSEHCGGLWNFYENLLMNDFMCQDHMYFICELADQ